MQINTLECSFKGPHQQRPWRGKKEQSRCLDGGDAASRGRKLQINRKCGEKDYLKNQTRRTTATI